MNRDASPEKVKKINIEEIKKYLEEANIDVTYAEMLLDKNLFNPFTKYIFPYPVNMYVYYGQEENENKLLYGIFSKPSGPGFKRFKTDHYYKVFEKEGMLLVYDSCIKTEKIHFVYDELPNHDCSVNEYQLNIDKITIINPRTNQIIAETTFTEKTPSRLAKDYIASVVNVNDDNILEDLAKFQTININQEEYDASKTEGDLFNIIDNIIKKQEQALKEKEEIEKIRARKYNEYLENLETKEKKFKLSTYLKHKKLVSKLTKANKGHISWYKSTPEYYIIDTDLGDENLIIPDGINLEVRLYGPNEGEKQYTIIDDKGNKIGILNQTPPVKIVEYEEVSEPLPQKNDINDDMTAVKNQSMDGDSQNLTMDQLKQLENGEQITPTQENTNSHTNSL